MRHNYSVTTPQDPASEPAKTSDEGQTHQVLVVRAPRYVRFIILGGVVGLVATLILTVSFPEQPGFSTGQVFGFLGIAFVTIGVALGAAAAIIIDRVATRRARTGIMEVVERVEAEIPETDESPETDQSPETDKGR